MYSRILLPVGTEAVERRAKSSATAARIAQDYNAVLHILSVVPRLGRYAASIFPTDVVERNRSALERVLNEIGAGVNLSPGQQSLHVAMGSVYDEIIALARKSNVDLI